MTTNIEDLKLIKQKEDEILEILSKYRKVNNFAHSILKENLSKNIQQIIDLIDN